MTASTPESAPPEVKDEVEDLEPETEAEEVEERKASYGSFGRYAPYLKEAEGSDAPSAVQTLRMDGCNLRAFVLEALGKLLGSVRDEPQLMDSDWNPYF